MRVSQEDGMTWYEGNGRKAVINKHGSWYSITSFWDRDGTHWCGGYGTESRPLTLKEAKDLAKRFIDGKSVPEELGGYEDNKPLEVSDACNE